MKSWTLLFLFLSPLKLNATSFYSKDYQSARASFRAHAASLGARWPESVARSFRVPSGVDDDLTVDYLWLPARQKTRNLVVVTSGVHGMEAFAGSAIQIMMLEEIMPQVQNSETGYLFVHTLNPFGFKYERRATEFNVNLNRNFSTIPETFHTPNEAYRKIQSVLEPAGKVHGRWTRFLSTVWQMGSRLVTGSFSVDELTEAVAQGQYGSPKGLEYGGNRPEPQVVDFLEFVRPRLGSYENILVLDLHTALGKKYHLHIIPAESVAAVHPDLFPRLFNTVEDKDLYDLTTGDSAGFYHTHGDLNGVIGEIARPDQKVVGVTLEFGTIGNGILSKLQTVNRLILENQGFQYGYSSAHLQRMVKGDLKDLCFPRDEKWRATAIEKSREVIRRLDLRLSHLP